MTLDYRKTFVFFMLLGIFVSDLRAQEEVSKFNFVNIKEGISKVGVYSILQDDYGFIWIGTNGSGLYRYDGIDYKSYKHIINDSTSISSSQINCSYLDSRNRLWVGTEVGLNLYDREKDQFRRIPVLSSNDTNGPTMPISALEEDHEGNLLIGSFRLGLFKMNLDNFAVEKFTIKESDVADPLVVRSVQTDSSGQIFVGTNMGLYTVDSKTGILQRLGIWNKGQLEFLEVSIRSMLIDDADHIWVGTLNTISKYSYL